MKKKALFHFVPWLVAGIAKQKYPYKNCVKNSIDYYSMHNVYYIVYNKPQTVLFSSFLDLVIFIYI